MRTRQAIYLDILRQGLLTIRNTANRDAEQCFAEADHLHNLPQLLGNLAMEELHKYYWEVQRPSYLRISKPVYLQRYQALWAELEEANQAVKQKIATNE